MCTVREISDLESLARYRSQWSELLAQTTGATFFQSLEWLETYWRHFGSGQRLRVLLVFSEEKLIGILPLVVRSDRRMLGTFRVLTYPLDNWASFYGPIGADPTTTLLAGLVHIRRTPRDWDLVELPWIDLHGTDQARTLWAMEHAGLPTQAEPWQQSAIVDLAGLPDWNAYWASRTSRWRNNVRRSEKKLAEHGEISYVRYRPAGTAQGDDDPRWDWYDACESIAQASWQGTSETGTTITHERVRPFLRDMHRVAAQAGTLDLNLLLVGGEPAAFNYAYHYGGSVFGLRTGFDGRLAQDGAGSVLQGRMIEDSFARGDHTYDLGPGYLECKRHWQTQTRWSYRYSHFARYAPRAQMMRVKRHAQRWLERRRGESAKATA